jgi:hypothetical protein
MKWTQQKRKALDVMGISALGYWLGAIDTLVTPVTGSNTSPATYIRSPLIPSSYITVTDVTGVTGVTTI